MRRRLACVVPAVAAAALTASASAHAAPAVSIDDAATSELTGPATAKLTFTLHRTSTDGGASSVARSTTDGTAISPDDYAAVTDGVATFAAGELTTTVVVKAVAD